MAEALLHHYSAPQSICIWLQSTTCLSSRLLCLRLQECSRLQHQAGDLEGEHKGHLAEVVADVEAMKQAMTDQRDELDKAAQRAKRQHDEDLSVQKARLATLTGTAVLRWQSLQLECSPEMPCHQPLPWCQLLP